jgi:hypothetical protein
MKNSILQQNQQQICSLGEVAIKRNGIHISWLRDAIKIFQAGQVSHGYYQCII